MLTIFLIVKPPFFIWFFDGYRMFTTPPENAFQGVGDKNSENGCADLDRENPRHGIPLDLSDGVNPHSILEEKIPQTGNENMRFPVPLFHAQDPLSRFGRRGLVSG